MYTRLGVSFIPLSTGTCSVEFLISGNIIVLKQKLKRKVNQTGSESWVVQIPAYVPLSSVASNTP